MKLTYVTLTLFPSHQKVTQISCGNVGKLTRIANAVADPAFTTLHPRKNPHAPFLVLGGFTDFILPSAYVNGHGAITGLANIAPVSFVIFPSLFKWLILNC